MSKDYYSILGVGKGATDDEIKRAFRKKAHQYHPDKKDGDEKKFKEINEAYQILSNKEKRSQYDQFGQTFNGAGGGGAGFQGFSGFGGFEDIFRNGFSTSGSNSAGGASPFGDIFDDFFGGGRQRRTSKTERSRGDDLILKMTLDFEEAALGTKKEVKYSRVKECIECGGTGAEKGSKVVTCSTCNGTGEVKDSHRTILGFFTQVRPCGDCEGKGKKPEKVCSNCSGKGIRREKESLTIKIPPGIDNGESLVVRGKGNEISGGEAGDLYVQVSIRPHKIFERKGNDILYNHKISFSQAALGDTVGIPTIIGNVDMKIPSGTQSDDVLRLKDMGVERGRGGSKGDQLVKITVVTPKKLSKEAKELFKKLKKIEKKKTNWFF